MKQKIFLISITVLLVFITDTNAQDWPQFLGPERNSNSPQKNLIRSWPENGPEVLWSANIGIGYGGPVVKEGKVYLLDRDDEVGDNLRCFDLANGKELWNFGYEAPVSVMFPGSRSVPAIISMRAGHTATYTVLTLTLTNRFGIKTSGLILVVIPETLHPMNLEDQVDLVAVVISLYGPFLNARLFMAICL